MRRTRWNSLPISLGLLAALGLGTACKDQNGSSELPQIQPAISEAKQPEPKPEEPLVMRLEPVGEPAPAMESVEIATGKQGAVASAEANATRIGVEILAAGGNAVDAAVAVGFALSVTHPSAGNIGGGGFMVLRFPDGKATAVDYRETAPGAASADMYLDE